MDTVSKATRSEIMSRVKSQNTKIELLIRKELWTHGLRYRKNSKVYFGKPDIVLKKYKVVIFVDSCFWHGCNQHCRMLTSRKEYWEQKILRNIKRDEEVNKYYKNHGWTIFRIWEHDIPEKISYIISEIYKLNDIQLSS